MTKDQAEEAVILALGKMVRGGLRHYGSLVTAQQIANAAPVYLEQLTYLGCDLRTLVDATNLAISELGDMPTAGEFAKLVRRLQRERLELVGVPSSEPGVTALVQVPRGLPEGEKAVAVALACKERGLPAPLPEKIREDGPVTDEVRRAALARLDAAELAAGRRLSRKEVRESTKELPDDGQTEAERHAQLSRLRQESA